MFETLIKQYRHRAEQALEQRLPNSQIHPTILHQAMRYAVLGGGKRIRPTLVYVTGTSMGVSLDQLDAPASAVEFIHAYSLIHDDLPIMDNDDLRHGKPTCHKVFGDAMAMLTGDALQSLAFQSLAENIGTSQDPALTVRLIGILAQAAGSQGMAGGQAIDLEAVGKNLNLAELEDMHIHKTGALIRASVTMGAISQPNLTADELQSLDTYAKCIGLAFQIRDDILDVTSDTKTLGKPQGADISLNKPTYPALLGLERAREHAKQLHENALDSLNSFGPKVDTLRSLANYIIERTY